MLQSILLPRRNTWGIPKCFHFHGASMVLPCDIHGSTVLLYGDFHDASMRFPRKHNAAPTVLPWYFHGISMVFPTGLPRDFLGSILLPLELDNLHGRTVLTRGVSWYFDGTYMGISMVSQWCFHGTSMVLPWDFHRASMMFPCILRWKRNTSMRCFRRASMVPPASMGLPWCIRGGSIVLSW